MIDMRIEVYMLFSTLSCTPDHYSGCQYFWNTTVFIMLLSQDQTEPFSAFAAALMTCLPKFSTLIVCTKNTNIHDQLTCLFATNTHIRLLWELIEESNCCILVRINHLLREVLQKSGQRSARTHADDSNTRAFEIVIRLQHISNTDRLLKWYMHILR